MNLYPFIELVANNKLDEIMPLLEKAKENAPADYVHNNQADDYAEQSIRQRIYELKTTRERTREETIENAGTLIKWISLHTLVS